MTLDLPLIIEPEDLEPLLGNPELVIVDAGSAQTYEQYHIPGAIHVPSAEMVCGIPPATGKLPSRVQLNALFSRIGYDMDKHFVVYDDEGGGWAGRFIWTLDVIGHEHYSYLNGGIRAWYEEGHAVEPKPSVPEPADVEVPVNRDVIASREYILDNLENPHVKIWDARSFEEYIGARQSARRGGHIPGAFNLDWLNTMDKNRNLRLLPLEELRRMLREEGVGDDDEIITHCQTHHRSGLTYVIARALGYKVRAYDGSWAEWGNLPDTPVEA